MTEIRSRATERENCLRKQFVRFLALSCRLKKTRKKRVDVHHSHSYRHYAPLKKGVIDEENACASIKRSRPKLLCFLTFLSCYLLLISSFFSFPTSNFPHVNPYEGEDETLIDSKVPACSSVLNGTICCDRSIRSDIRIMKGDIRTNSSSFSVFLYTYDHVTSDLDTREPEKIKPYTRKWEPSTMATIDELTLISKNTNASTIENGHKCHVNHNVPAIFFSTGGYTGNVYHEFNDGLIPLYITSQKYNKKVVFVILEYHKWWVTKYDDVVSQLSDYEPIDFNRENRTHCFSEAIVGLRIHDELAINATLMENKKTIKIFMMF
ncbi:EGF domain-specific O-linked N-acetylglucosamine transferase-like protein [Tanacetum coccineum]